MRKYLEKNISLILKIILYMNPIIDLFTSIMINYFNINITIGMVVRMLFLIFIIFYYLFIKKNVLSYKKNYLIIVALFIILNSLVTIVIKDYNVLFFELSWIFRIFYFVILLTLIEKKDLKIKIDDLINIVLIYLGIISVSNILNISFNSYTQGKVGSVGLFNSGNEISVILSILNPILIYYIFNNKNNIKKIILAILMIYTYFNIGSKIVIISLILSLIYNLYLYIKLNKIKRKNIVITLLLLTLIVIFSIIIIPRTNFYYNIILHLNYLGINSINDIFSYNFLNRFIFSDRLSYLEVTNNYYVNSSLIEKLFGIGFIQNYATDYVSYKTIEMDLFDIFYRIGIIGFIIYTFSIIKEIKYNFNELNKIVKFSLVMTLLIALLVGHTLVAPSVSIFIVYMLKYNKEMNK